MLDKLFFALVMIGAIAFSFTLGHEFGLASAQGNYGYKFDTAKRAFVLTEKK